MNQVIELYEARNSEIYAKFESGVRQKVLAKNYELSESRVKAIIGEQKRKNATTTSI